MPLINVSEKVKIVLEEIKKRDEEGRVQEPQCHNPRPTSQTGGDGMSPYVMTRDEAICDLIWTHPDAQKIHSEELREEPKEYSSLYIVYDIYRYPREEICQLEDKSPVFITTKRGCVEPKFWVYRRRSAAYKRVEKEKENFDKDIENERKLTTIGLVARR